MRTHATMNRSSATAKVAAVGLCVLLAGACAENGVTMPDARDPGGKAVPTPLGLVEVTITGLADGAQPSASVLSAATVRELDALRAARRSTSTGALTLQSLTLPADLDGAGDGTIQLEPVSVGSFTDGERGAGGVRYLRATFRVRNAREDGTAYDTERHNLTFLAVDTDGTLGETALTELSAFDGNPVPGAASLALDLLPTGAVVLTTGGVVVSQGPDVLQALTESEVAAIDLTGHADVNTVFPYGFVVRTPGNFGSRTLVANPIADQFDGIVTFAFKVPLQAAPADDPFEISVVFLAVDDTETRVTESLEERTPDAAAALQATADALGVSTAVTLLGNSPTLAGGHTVHRICRVRTAGVNPASPLATLVDAGSPCLDGDALPGHVRVVDEDAAGGGDGLTWATAFNTLQDALTCVRTQTTGQPCDGVDEIWVAEGVYYPDEGTGYTPGDESVSFELIESVELYGGFVGVESVRDLRDPALHLTVLSGDVDHDDVVDGDSVIVDWEDLVGGASNARVLLADGTVTPITRATVVDGFTITGGGGPGTAASAGGLYCDGSGTGGQCNPTIRRVTFSGNVFRAVRLQGLNGGESSPLFTDVVFRGNSPAGTADGGAVLAAAGSGGTSSPEFVRVTFVDNDVIVTRSGGAVYHDGTGGTSEPRYTSVVFQGNTAVGGGGAMFNEAASPTLVNVVFIDNTTSGGFGGAISGSGSPNVTVVNATFRGNTAPGSGSGGGAILSSAINAANIIVWGNSPGPAIIAQGTVDNSIIEGGCPANVACADLLNQDPLFVDAAGGDLRLTEFSPAVDAGGNGFVLADVADLDGDGNTTEPVPFDLDGVARFFDWHVTGTAIVDIGAYEKQ